MSGIDLTERAAQRIKEIMASSPPAPCCASA
jgi:Fe-S cluster assembly iron-binding protein IscA